MLEGPEIYQTCFDITNTLKPPLNVTLQIKKRQTIRILAVFPMGMRIVFHFFSKSGEKYLISILKSGCQWKFKNLKSPCKIYFRKSILSFSNKFKLGKVYITKSLPSSLIIPPGFLSYPHEHATKRWEINGFIKKFKQLIKKSPNHYLTRILFNGKFVSGIGVYCISEIFHIAKFQPFIRLKDMKHFNIIVLFVSCETILNKSLECKGAEKCRDYERPNGEKGEFTFTIHLRPTILFSNISVYKVKGPHHKNIYTTFKATKKY